MGEQYNDNAKELVLNATDIDIKQSKQRLEKLLPTARLIDDYYFSLYAQCYPEDFSMIVGTFLDKDIDIDISTVKYQRALILPDNGKDVRFDIAANTKDGGQVVLEVESKKKFSELRLRYYMSRMDSDLLSKGEQYNELKDSYVIVVSPIDMRKQNKPRYFVRNCYVESPTEIGNDPAIVDNGQVAVYINASYKNERDYSKLADLIHDFTCEDADEIKTEIIKKHSKGLKSKGKEYDRMLALAENTVLRLPLYNGRLLTEAEQKAAYDEGMAKGTAKALSKIFANYMTSYFRNPQQSLHQAIQTCKQILPEWDDNKFKEELTSLQKKLNIKLNLDSIFLNEDIKDKIKNKDFENAYKLYCDDESISSDNKPIDFMKEVLQEHGIDAKILDDAAKAITDYMGEITAFKAKLLQDIMKTDEYQNILHSNGGGKGEGKQNQDINS